MISKGCRSKSHTRTVRACPCISHVHETGMNSSALLVIKDANADHALQQLSLRCWHVLPTRWSSLTSSVDFHKAILQANKTLLRRQKHLQKLPAVWYKTNQCPCPWSVRSRLTKKCYLIWTEEPVLWSCLPRFVASLSRGCATAC